MEWLWSGTDWKTWKTTTWGSYDGYRFTLLFKSRFFIIWNGVGEISRSEQQTMFMFIIYDITRKVQFLRGYHTLQGDNSLKSVERFNHMMFVCRFKASRWSKPHLLKKIIFITVDIFKHTAKKNKKIKWADQILPEVYGTTLIQQLPITTLEHKTSTRLRYNWYFGFAKLSQNGPGMQINWKN